MYRCKFNFKLVVEFIPGRGRGRSFACGLRCSRACLCYVMRMLIFICVYYTHTHPPRAQSITHYTPILPSHIHTHHHVSNTVACSTIRLFVDGQWGFSLRSRSTPRQTPRCVHAVRYPDA